MINYENVLIKLNKVANNWDYYFDMETVVGDDLYHAIYLVDRNEVKLEVFHDCMVEAKTEDEVIHSCLNGIDGHLANIKDFYDILVRDLDGRR